MKTKLLLVMASIFFSVNMVAVTVNYGIATEQNKRGYQEDRYRCASIRNCKGKRGGNFFGVYDGHGGSQTASFLAQNLHDKFARRLHNGNSVETALSRAFLSADRDVLNRYIDGSTALVVYLDNETNMLHYAWTGDTRLSVENGAATQDHKPDSPQEKQRIEKAGGKIEIYGVPRVNGFAVARAIGDKSVKNAGKGQVIARPECGQFQLTPDNNFMILATDGIWDVIDNKNANMLVKDALKSGHSAKSAAHSLKNEAIRRGSGDNITVIVAQFDWNNNKV